MDSQRSTRAFLWRRLISAMIPRRRNPSNLLYFSSNALESAGRGEGPSGADLMIDTRVEESGRLENKESDPEKRRREREKEKEREKRSPSHQKGAFIRVLYNPVGGPSLEIGDQEEISDTFGAYGDVVSIDLIPPRGCAFIVMNRRQDAVRALDRLKNTKLQGKTITHIQRTYSNLGVGSWERCQREGVERLLGGWRWVSYIPWNKLRDETNLEEFEDGGCMDEDTLPEFLKNKPHPPDSKSLDHNAAPPLPADNENSEDSMAMCNPPLPPHSAPTQMQGLFGNHSGGGIPSLLDPSALAAVGGKPSDTDGRGMVVFLLQIL
ncbi:Splicing factor, arginine/serine-rich 15 [Orchesella cincta]|uniref:Splicing factor, arginine/serine-rich 15 n=1 Tax=Orchesella cincta TaxID=48709 RepID=A0A1D2MNI1_ORCCI|nr:Splicing factor, arginine/serine-rich 15 [Orchesella cincta]